MAYKHTLNGNEISDSEYNILPAADKMLYKKVDDDNNGSFGTSMMIGAVTDSALLGGLIGGDIVGGIVGDLLNGGDL